MLTAKQVEEIWVAFFRLDNGPVFIQQMANDHADGLIFRLRIVFLTPDAMGDCPTVQASFDLPDDRIATGAFFSERYGYVA